MHGRGLTGTNRRMAARGRGLLAAAFVLAALAGGCSSGGGLFGGPSASAPDAAVPPPPSGGLGPITGFLSGSSAKGPQTAAGAQPDINCPPVDIRRGASTLTIGPTGEKTAMTLKYQGEFVREARECSVVNGAMVMKIGVEGRVIVGPGGGPGQVDVPLRLAVVYETPSGGTRAVQTKFFVIPVVIGPNQGGATFSHIEEAVTFPLPAPTSQLDDYIVYIGFDPNTAEAQAKQSPKSKSRPKAKPQPAASAN
jgi:hypothetical protein